MYLKTESTVDRLTALFFINPVPKNVAEHIEIESAHYQERHAQCRDNRYHQCYFNINYNLSRLKIITYRLIQRFKFFELSCSFFETALSSAKLNSAFSEGHSAQFFRKDFKLSFFLGHSAQLSSVSSD